MEKDRNLLFGILAVQLKGVSPAQLVETAAAWSTDPKVPLAQRLVEKGLLRERDRDLLERMVNEAVVANGGDPSVALQSFGGEEQIRRSFAGMGLSELNAMNTIPMKAPSLFTETGEIISGVEEAPGRYTLVSQHAEGGMGRILLVHDEFLGRSIALKELLPTDKETVSADRPSPVRNTASLVMRFLQEARITGQLEHPAIVPVYELGRRSDGTLYYTMKLVRGKTLAEAIRDCRSMEERLRLLPSYLDLCQAIAYAHSRGVIHRDIKPANVMVGQFGETVVLDWGLAKVTDVEDVCMDDMRTTLHFLELDETESLAKTAYGRALGTPHYMPPEQADGRIDEIDERSDVYSLGAVLYEMLTGTTPYTGKGTREIIGKVLNSNPTPVLAAAADVPPELAGICEKAIRRDPAMRYQSAAELAEDVQRFVTGSLVSAYRYSMGETLSRLYRKHRAVVNCAAVCLVLLLAAGILSYVSIWNARNREREQRVIAEEKAYLSQIHAAQALIGESDYPAANRALWQTDPTRRGWEWGYLLNRANPEIYTVETPGFGIHGAFFSPDGTKIMTLSVPGVGSIRDAETGKALVELEGERMYSTSCLFAPDGTKIAIGTSEGVGLWDVTSGKRLWFSRLAAGVYCLAFDGDGSRLFTGCGDKVVRVWDAASGELVRAVPTELNPVHFLAFNAEKQRLAAGMGDQETGWVQVWSLPEFQPLASFRGMSPSLSHDGSILAAQDGPDIILFAADTGNELRRIATQQDLNIDVRFSDNDKLLIAASWDGSAILMDVDRGEVVRRLPCQGPVRNAFFVDEGRFILTCTSLMQVSLWPVDRDTPLYSVKLSGPGLMMADQAPGGRRIALATTDQFFQVWDAFGPTGLQPLGYYAGLGLEAGKSAPSVKFAVASDVLGVRWSGNASAVINAADATVKAQCLGPKPFMGNGDIALSPDGRRFAAIPDRRTPVVWDVDTGALLYVLRDHPHRATVVAWSPDGSRLAAGYADGAVRILAADSGETTAAPEGHADAVFDIRFSADGARVVTASRDKTAAIWDASTGAKLADFGHALPVLSSALSERGALLATFAADAIVRIWGVGNAKEIQQFQTHGYTSDDPSERTAQVSFVLGDRFLLTRCSFATTRLWDVESGALLAAFEEDDRVALRSGGLPGIGIDARGVIRRIEAGSWLRSGMNGESEPQWKEAYAAYRVEQARGVNPPRPVPEQHQYLVALATETLEEGLKTLVDSVRAQEAVAGPWEGGVEVQQGAGQFATFRLGVEPGERITRVNGKTFATRAEALQAFEAAVLDCESAQSAKASLTFTRQGHEVTFDYRTLPVRREALSVTLTPEQATSMLDAELAVIPNCETICRYSPPGVAYLFVHTDGPAYERAYAPTGLQSNDIVIEFDGQRFTQFAQVKEYLARVRERIEAGEQVTLTNHVLRGQFQELDVTFTVAPEKRRQEAAP